MHTFSLGAWYVVLYILLVHFIRSWVGKYFSYNRCFFWYTFYVAGMGSFIPLVFLVYHLYNYY
jgi:hypothetical protein